MPGLHGDGLVGGASYFDAQVAYPERLVVENVRDAVAHGAELVTYARVTRIVIERGRATGVEWQARTGAAARVRRSSSTRPGRGSTKCSVRSGSALDRRHEGQSSDRRAVSGRAALRACTSRPAPTRGRFSFCRGTSYS